MTAAVPLEPLRLRTLSAAEQVVRVEASVVLQLLDVVDVDPVPRHRLAGRCSWSRSSRATIATASCVQARQPCGEQHQELLRQAHRAFEPAPGSVSCSAGKVYHCCVAKSTAAARFRPVLRICSSNSSTLIRIERVRSRYQKHLLDIISASPFPKTVRCSRLLPSWQRSNGRQRLRDNHRAPV